METSECSSVPYSISDIQLPESPGPVLKCKEIQKDESGKTEPLSDMINVKSPPLDNKTQSNGDAVPENLNSSHEEMSESETKEGTDKSNQRKDVSDSRQSDESSDVESDRSDSNIKKKSFGYEDTTSNVIDSDEIPPKEVIQKDNISKRLKSQQQLNESDKEKSSDSEKYHHRIDSKRKSHVKHRKRNRRSRSQSSPSSSSHSSDSSPKHRHSKKSVVTKSKDFIDNDDSNNVSDINLKEKSKQFKKDSNSTPIPSTSSKKRYKIKRDNAPIEVSPETAVSSKSIEKNGSHFSPHSPPKQESSEFNEDVSELLTLTYTSRKVNLSNPKLKKRTSQDESGEIKSKTSKIEISPVCKKMSNPIVFSADFLKNLFPEFKPMGEATSPMELDTEDLSFTPVDEKNTAVPTDVSDVNESGMGRRESTSQIDFEDSESREPNFEEAPEQGPVSKIIFIQNLVRPFTLNQLKDLVKQSGKIVEEYFWIDKIKSKCFVMYETEKDAVKARNALNNTRWPSSNPKILSVEFSNEEELEQHKKGNEPPPPKPVMEPPMVETPEIIETRITHHPVEEHKRKDRERRKERERSKHQVPVREWDKDKIIQDSPEREHIPKEDKPRSSEKKEKRESKKRPNEDTPAKLLDDLFQKTKNAPCIYWLPLTEEQAKEKEEAKKLRKLEREKRNQQQKEQEVERRNRRAHSSRRSREKENRKSSTRSRSPVSRRR